MNKKTLFSLVGAASIAVSLSATAPVLAAETTNPNTTSTTTNTDQKDTTTTTPSAGQTGTTDTSKTSTTGQTGTTDTSKTSTTGQTGTTDTSKTPATGTTDTTKPTTSKPINTADLNKAMNLNGKLAKLTKNSYVYDAKGKRIKNAKLKKGTIIAVNGVITPDNQVLIGYNKKGKYIKVNNVELFKAVQYKVKKNAYVYDSKGKQNMRVYLPKGKKVTVFRTKKIKGVKYVAVSDSLYIKWSVLDHKSGKVVSG